jgi:tetratricopeptide (TPR) repeat protein
VILILATVGLGASTVLIARERAAVIRQRDLARLQFGAATAARDAEARAREQAEAVTRFLVDAFRRPDPEQDGRELRVVDLLTSAVAKLDTEFDGSPRIKGELLNTLGRTIDNLGLPAQAADILGKALVVRQVTLGPDHDDTLATRNSLGEAYLAAGRTSEALALFEAVLKRRQATLGPDHDDTLDAQNNLAIAYQMMGDLARAVPLLERTLEARKSKLGPDHDATLSTQNALASAFSDADRNAEALSLFEATLKAREARLAPDHPRVLLSRNNLAFALINVGRPAEAIPLLEKTLRLRESKLGPDHPYTINTRTNLAVAYGKSGRPDRATPLFEHALKQRIATLGPDHPETLVAQANLGRNYHRVGHPAEGARLLEEVLRRARDRPDAMARLGRLATVLAAAYDASGQFTRSEPLYREELAKARKSFGLEDPRTAGWMAQLGWNLLKQEKWPEAELILRDSLAVRERTQPNAWNTFNTRSLLGGALLGEGKLAEAEPLIVQGYEGMKAREATIPSEGQPLLTEAAERLVLLYEQTGRPDQAAALLGVTNRPGSNGKEKAPLRRSKP